MHPWHDLTHGEDAPEIVNVMIEVTNGSSTKYELDKDSGLIKLDRVLFSPMYYPANYGFIPKTYCDDKDPLDCLVICSVDLMPGCLVDARVIGVMKMIDGGEGDDKLIAVADNDAGMAHIKDLSDLPEHKINQIRVFFQDYKKLEKKTVEVKEFEGKDVAQKLVMESIELYKENF